MTSESETKQKRLFVVEDSADFRFLLKQLFESEGFLVEYAANGKEALEKLQLSSELPDLILLDLMMPIMDGYEFRQHQESDPRLQNIPVVIMSAHADIQTSKIKTHVKDYVRKPQDIDKLIDIVNRNWA